jgi:hypothetical protein
VTEPLNDPTVNPELARKNNVWGWAIFGAFALLVAGTLAVAFVYLALAD